MDTPKQNFANISHKTTKHCSESLIPNQPTTNYLEFKLDEKNRSEDYKITKCLLCLGTSLWVNDECDFCKNYEREQRLKRFNRFR